MAGTRAAQRYAKAILELAKEKNLVEEINANMRDVSATIKGSSELQNVLRSPVIKPADKSAALKSIFKGSNAITASIFNVLATNGRINILDKVVAQFIVLYDKLHHISVAKVTTATELTPEMETKVLEKVKELTGNKVTLIKKVDPSLIGGFVLRIEDMQYDASVSGQLNSIRKDFKNNARV